MQAVLSAAVNVDQVACCTSTDEIRLLLWSLIAVIVMKSCPTKRGRKTHFSESRRIDVTSFQQMPLQPINIPSK